MSKKGQRALEALVFLRAWQKKVRFEWETFGLLNRERYPDAVAMNQELDIAEQDIDEAIACVAKVHGIDFRIQEDYLFSVSPDCLRIRFCQLLNFYDCSVFGANQCRCSDRSKCVEGCGLRGKDDSITEILTEVIRCINQIHGADYLEPGTEQ